MTTRIRRTFLGLLVVLGGFATASTAHATCESDDDCAYIHVCEQRTSSSSTKYCTCNNDSSCSGQYEHCTDDGYCVEGLCGDGVVDDWEQCDDGADNSDTAPDACRAGNYDEGGCRLAWCGDNVTDTGEECDDGSRNSNYEPSACRGDCTLPYCGDGIVDTDFGEECDEGADNSDAQDATCSTQCIIPGCGNGTLEPGEQCDDNNTSDADSCTGQCRRNVCGDGHIWSSVEQCEYESTWDQGDCRYDCGQDESACGNGTVDPGEGCDDGADRNSEEPDNPCRTDCQPQRCGDGVVDTGEECDLGEGCGPNCLWVTAR